MLIEQSYLVNNECYKANKKISPSGIVVHSVGCAQPNRSVFVRTWNVARPNGSQVCVHAFLDKDGVSQTLPWDHRCWGCGSAWNGSYNNTHIQFEICEPSKIKYSNGQIVSYDPSDKDNLEHFNKCYNNAVDLCVMLCKQFSLDVSTIVSHKEAHAIGYASNHGDVEHWWKYHNKTMDQFRSDVRAKIYGNDTKTDGDNKQSSTNNIQSIKVGDSVKLTQDAVQYDGSAIRTDYKDKVYKVYQIGANDRVVLTINDVVIYAVNKKHLVNVQDAQSNTPGSTNNTPFTVRVSIKNLNIRLGPGTDYGIVRYIEPGVYTIVDVKNNFGKLKSGIGWISLSYTTRL